SNRVCILISRRACSMRASIIASKNRANQLLRGTAVFARPSLCGRLGGGYAGNAISDSNHFVSPSRKRSVSEFPRRSSLTIATQHKLYRACEHLVTMHGSPVNTHEPINNL